MLSERQINALLEVYQRRMQEVTDGYLRKVGRHIRDIGKMLPSDVNRLTEMRRLQGNMRDMKRQVAIAAGQSMKDTEEIFRAVAADNLDFADRFYGSGSGTRVKGAPKASVYIERIIKSQLRVTDQAFTNLSKTTLVSKAYRNAVDVAIQTVQGGVEDYGSAIRRSLKQVASQGLQVEYPPKRPGALPYRRRVDTAVRQNVLDGVRSLNNDIMMQIGKEYGANGVELSAHELCAPDHIDYQGRQFDNIQFNTIQSTLRRPFGQWNCKHTMHPVILGVSPRAYSDKELERFKELSTEEIEIDGVTKTRYQWTQEQRQVETAIRWARDVGTIAGAAHNPRLARVAGADEKALKAYYEKISDAARIPERKDRMYVDTIRSQTAAMGRKAADIGHWPEPNPAAKITKDRLAELEAFASKRGFKVLGFENFDGDVGLIEDIIINGGRVLNDYPEVTSKKLVQLRVSKYIDPGDYAVSSGHCINLNVNAVRSRDALEKDYLEYVNGKPFFVPGTSCANIGAHEVAHIVSEYFGLSDAAIAAGLDPGKVSEYATANSHEMVAESISGYYSNVFNDTILTVVSRFGNMISERRRSK